MSLAAESPLNSSSSSDDFAALLDAELEYASSDTSPDQENGAEDESDDGFIKEEKIKRRKVEDSVGVKELQGSTSVIAVPQESVFRNRETDTPNKGKEICPPHPGFFKGLCMRCGQLEEDDGSGVGLGYIHKDLKVSSTEIDRLRGVDSKKLLGRKKLILVLDLDHTLLNSTRLVDMSSEEEYLLKQADSLKDDPNRSLFKLETMHMLTKLRPFVHNFLMEASTLFEMYVYTMAEHSYALEMANLLDPKRVYFDSKVISQSHCTQRHQKGLDVVLGHDSTVVILDDTEIVWSKHRENLILMERYHFFASSCRQFSFNEKSLSEMKRDEREADGTLANILNVLKRAHQIFFDPVSMGHPTNRDIRQVLKKIRQEILQGCTIVFSRLFSSNSKAEDQQIWKLSEQLGATCSTDVNPSITHVVAIDRGTEKARWAVQNNKFLVHPRWIEAANYRWQRFPEQDFPISISKPS